GSRARSARRRAVRCRNRGRARLVPRRRRRSRARAGTLPRFRGRGRRRRRRTPLRAGCTPRPASRAAVLDAQDLGLGGRELLVGEHALAVQLRQVLELRVRILGGRSLWGRRLLLVVGGLILGGPLLVLPACNPA